MSASLVGSMFILFSGSYAVAAVPFGRISDKTVSTTQKLEFLSNLNMFLPFLGVVESDNFNCYLERMIGVPWLVDYRSVTFSYGPENFIRALWLVNKELGNSILVTDRLWV